MKKLLIPFVLVLTLLLIAAFSGYSWYKQAISMPNGDSTERKVFEVKTGEDVATISNNLASAGLLQSPTAFQIYAKLNAEQAQSIQAGYFDIAPKNSIEEIMQILQKSRAIDDVSIVIPEGLRYDEVASIVATSFQNNANFSKTDFLAVASAPTEESLIAMLGNDLTGKVKAYTGDKLPTTLEGFLFPDTYLFTSSADTADVMTKLVATFFEKAGGVQVENGLTDYENLILASIVERESFPVDYEGVAGVFLKRIDIGEKLGSDITVLYILKRWNPEPTAAELRIDSPFNTRLNYGLPPTPIANPGAAAVESTAKATQGEYLFFIADKEGIIRYGRNVSEHEANIRKYLN